MSLPATREAPVVMPAPRARPLALRLRSFHFWALLPVLAFLLLLSLYPIWELVRMAFSVVKVENQEFIWTFHGLGHFQKLLGDTTFRAALSNTLMFVVVSVFLEMVLGFGLALLAQGKTWLGAIFKLAMILPVLVTPVAISITWFLVYNREMGLLNALFKLVGIPDQFWLGTKEHAMKAIIAVDVWHWTPFVFLILAAGLTSIPRTLYEAAAIDGANRFQTLVHITIPAMKRSLITATTFRTVFAFKVFDEIFLLTGGGPGTATEVLSTYTKRVFFEGTNYGYGAALGLTTLSLVILCLVLFQVPMLLRRRD